MMIYPEVLKEANIEPFRSGAWKKFSTLTPQIFVCRSAPPEVTWVITVYAQRIFTRRALQDEDLMQRP